MEVTHTSSRAQESEKGSTRQSRDMTRIDPPRLQRRGRTLSRSCQVSGARVCVCCCCSSTNNSAPIRRNASETPCPDASSVPHTAYTQPSNGCTYAVSVLAHCVCSCTNNSGSTQHNIDLRIRIAHRTCWMRLWTGPGAMQLFRTEWVQQIQRVQYRGATRTDRMQIQRAWYLRMHSRYSGCGTRIHHVRIECVADTEGVVPGISFGLTMRREIAAPCAMSGPDIAQQARREIAAPCCMSVPDTA
eukprot:2005886-Rhodomonas_salina.1